MLLAPTFRSPLALPAVVVREIFPPLPACPPSDFTVSKLPAKLLIVERVTVPPEPLPEPLVSMVKLPVRVVVAFEFEVSVVLPPVPTEPPPVAVMLPPAKLRAPVPCEILITPPFPLPALALSVVDVAKVVAPDVVFVMVMIPAVSPLDPASVFRAPLIVRAVLVPAVPFAWMITCPPLPLPTPAAFKLPLIES
jgi:hypothetical protein